MESKSPILTRSRRNFEQKDIKMHVGQSREESYTDSEMGLRSQIAVEAPVYKLLNLYWDINGRAFIHWEPLKSLKSHPALK